MFASDRIVVDMGLSEYAVTQALERLISQGKTISQVAVAQEARCSVSTVSRVWKVLRERGELIFEGTPRGGYQYTYTKRSNQNSCNS
jgi:predicted transcriptional regulator